MMNHPARARAGRTEGSDFRRVGARRKRGVHAGPDAAVKAALNAMKNILAQILSAVLICQPMCALRADVPPPKVEKAAAPDGTSYEKAVPVKSVDAEYQWLKKKYPGYTIKLQSLRMKDGKPFDVLAITTKGGTEMEVFFDISSFFGK
jgi:hypothetical protein